MTFACALTSIVVCLMLCGSLGAADPQFIVTPTSLAFGDVQFSGEPKNLKFIVKNPQTTPLVLNITKGSNFITMNPSGQVTLNPGETKSVELIFPAPLPAARCDLLSDTVLISSATQRATVAVTAKLICADLEFVGGSVNVSLQNNQIVAKFSVINTGTLKSNACTGVVLLDGGAGQRFQIPVFTDRFTIPTNQKGYQLTFPATPGQHVVEVRVDTDNQNREPREDNKVSAVITVP